VRIAGIRRAIRTVAIKRPQRRTPVNNEQACLEAFGMILVKGGGYRGWINDRQPAALTGPPAKSGYGAYVPGIVKETAD